MHDLDPNLAQAFDRTAGSYARARPGYPDAAIAHVGAALGLRPGARVLDLGAGTGKLTEQLVAAGYTVTAVEPLPGMRAELAAALPGVPVFVGSAEAIGQPDAAFDAITAGQAFHWFDPERALPEMARVLAPGGGIALLWNERDERTPWVAEMQRIIHWHDRGPYDAKTDWAARIAGLGYFSPLESAAFEDNQPMTRALLEDATLSRSYIAKMEPAERAPILAGVLELVRDFPEPFDLPHICRVWTARKVSP
jgi:SAM-dependent methyltransferase